MIGYFLNKRSSRKNLKSMGEFEMKKIIGVLAAVTVGAAVLWWMKDAIVRNAVAVAVRQATGLELKMESLKVSLAQTRIDAKGIRILNSSAFGKDRVFVDLPILAVDYDWAALFRKEIHLEELTLFLNEVVIVKNAKGDLNLDALNPAGSQKSGGSKAEEGKAEKPAGGARKGMEMRIDKLHLKIGKVVYKDYSAGGEPSVKNFDLRVDAEFKNIRDPRALTAIVVANVLSQSAIRSLTKLDPGSLLSGMGMGTYELKNMGVESLSGVAQGLQTQAGSLFSAAKEKLGGVSEESANSLGKLFGSLTGEKK